MDFWLDDSDEAFRAEVRCFIDEHFSTELRRNVYQSGVSHDPAFVMALGERNWIAPDWGRDGIGPLSATRCQIIIDELTRAEAPTVAMSTSMVVARAIAAVGSEFLRKTIIPEVTWGRKTISLGMSEPEAGSDVAAINTRASFDGSFWSISGQKMFTTNGHVCDYIYVLARTEHSQSRHVGLTTFLVPLESAGLEVQGLFTLSGERTNIVFLEDVRVDDAWRIGEPGQGWQSLVVALQDEHSFSFAPHLARLVEAVEGWLRYDASASGLLDDTSAQLRLMRAVTEMEVATLLSTRVAWLASVNQPARHEGPMSKLFSTEALVRSAEDLSALVGPRALVSKSDPHAVAEGAIEHALRFSVGTTIYAGTSEIQRNIIAQTRCGLPRS